MPSTSSPDLNEPAHGAAGYEKRVHTVRVAFAESAGTIATLEGPVRCQPGDAIVTGVTGEQWPVTRAAFEQKYSAVAPATMGSAGDYQTQPARVLALRLNAALDVPLPAGKGTLRGGPGDWLVQYGPGDQAIVASAIFPQTYRRAIDGAPLLIGLAGALDAAAAAWLARLDALLPNTTLIVLHPGPDGQVLACTLACTLAAGASSLQTMPERSIALPPLPGIQADVHQRQAAFLLRHCSFVLGRDNNAVSAALAAYALGLPFWTQGCDSDDHGSQPRALFTLAQPAPVLDGAGAQALLAWLANSARGLPGGGLRRAPRLHLLVNMLPDVRQLWSGLTLGQPRHDAAHGLKPLFNQLRELDIFNAELAAQAPPPGTASAGHRLEQLRESADRLADHYQRRWQRLLFSTTKGIATHGGLVQVVRARRWAGVLPELAGRAVSLAGLGLLAALSLGAFSELASCDADDRFAWLGCATPGWQQHAAPAFMAVYLLALALAFWRYGDAKRGEFERKHQDYRLFAECLRVQHLWAQAGIRCLAADALPRNGTQETTWVSHAVRASALFGNDAPGGWAHATLDWAMRHFVVEQMTYHEQTLLVRREQAAGFLAARAKLALAVFVACVLAMAANTAAEAWFEAGVDGVAHHLLMLLTLGSLASWAGSKKVLDSLGVEGEIKRGTIMLAALRHASDCIGQQAASDRQAGVAPAAHLRDILVGLGTMFVADQAYWHALHRERPLEAVTGG